MPRAFTPAETAAIRARLMAAGSDCFARQGVRKTTVDELARAAGISKGAFYGFFNTKEDLAVTLIEEYELSVHAEVEAAVRADPHRGIDTLLHAALRATERNPLLPVMMSDEGLRVMRSMDEPRQREFVDRDLRLANRVLDLLNQAGATVTVDADTLMALLRSLVFIGWHRQDIGPELVETLTRWLAPTLRTALLGTRTDQGGSSE